MKSEPDSLLVTAVKSLSLRKDRRYLLQSLSLAQWPELLRLTDESRLTLAIAERAAQYLPDEIRFRLSRDLNRNALRQQRMLETYSEIAAVLNSRGIEFLVLKGAAQYAPYRQKVACRPQYDIDLYCPGASAQAAAEAIMSLGYRSVRSTRGPETDHLPPLVREPEWKWQNDYFDPDLPFSIEIHHRFWNPARERFDVAASEQFWSRRVQLKVDGLVMPALHPIDALSYATWHLIRHLVRGDLKIFHVYELALFLKASAADDAFWSQWRRIAHPKERIVEAIAFRLASGWFDCELHPEVAQLMDRMPAPVRKWFDLFEMSPVTSAEIPNKDEVFLHLAVVAGWLNRVRVLRQRVFPMNPPTVGRGQVQLEFLSRRAAHHLLAIVPVIRSASLWCFESGAVTRD